MRRCFFILKNILVFFGGVSTERDISVITGILTCNTMDKEKYNVTGVYISANGTFYISEKFKSIAYFKNPDYKDLKRVTFLPGDNRLFEVKRKLKPLFKVDCVINCLHGKNGEDGTLSGFLKMFNIPLASPDIFASSMCMDKDLTKIVLKGLNVPTLEYFRIRKKDFFKKSEKYVNFIGKKLGYPIIIKPAKLGSSIGIKKAENKEELFNYLSESFSFDTKSVCEKYLKGARDINVAACYYDGKIHISEAEEAFNNKNILTFEDKYGNSDKAVGSNRQFPAEITKKQREKIREYVERIYRKCDFSGIIRFDFLIYEESCFLNEINTVPGSLSYYLFCNKFSEFALLLDNIIKDAEDRQRMENNLIKVFESDVLSGDFKNIKK